MDNLAWEMPWLELNQGVPVRSRMERGDFEHHHVISAVQTLGVCATDFRGFWFNVQPSYPLFRGPRT